MRCGFVLAILQVQVGDVVVADTGCVVIFELSTLVHVARGRQIDDREHILGIRCL